MIMTQQSLLNWLHAIKKESGYEILLVQTIRNSLMGASVIASTSLVAIIGVVTFGRSLAAPTADTGQSSFHYAHLMVNLASIILVIALTEALLALRTLSRAGFGAGVGHKVRAPETMNSATPRNTRVIWRARCVNCRARRSGCPSAWPWP